MDPGPAHHLLLFRFQVGKPEVGGSYDLFMSSSWLRTWDFPSYDGKVKKCISYSCEICEFLFRPNKLFKNEKRFSHIADK